MKLGSSNMTWMFLGQDRIYVISTGSTKNSPCDCCLYDGLTRVFVHSSGTFDCLETMADGQGMTST